MQDACLAPGSHLPQSLLEASGNLSGYIQVYSQSEGFHSQKCSSIQWLIYVRHGRVTYASNSVDPFERLERYLRGLAQGLPQLNSKARAQVRKRFKSAGPETITPEAPLTADYQAMVWMVEQGWLDPLLAGTLASKLTAEVLEGYLLLPEANYRVQQQSLRDLPKFCELDISSLVKRTQARLQAWQRLSPVIRSPYQRPYLAGEAIARQKLPPDAVDSLSRLLIGFNFRQLGMFLKQDELQIAQQFSALVEDDIIVLRDPVAPFNQLPPLGASAD